MISVKSLGLTSLPKYFGIYAGMLGIVASIVLSLFNTPYSTHFIEFILPGIAILLGLIIGFIDTLIYNGLALTQKGIKFVYEDNTIKNFDVFSVALVVSVLSAIYGLMFNGLLGFITYLILGFIGAAIAAYLYNVIAYEIGGIKVEIKDNELKKVMWFPAAKISAIVLALIMLLIEFILVIVSIFLPVYGQSLQIALLVGLGTGLLLLFFALCIGFVAGAFDASIYNFIAKHFGGMILNISKEQKEQEDQPPATKSTKANVATKQNAV